MATICILLPAHWGAMKGGAEQQADLLSRYISEHTGHEVVYLTRHAPDDDVDYGYEIRAFRGAPLWQHSRWGKAPDALALYDALNEVQPDVILHMVASAYTGVAVRYAQNNGVPFIWYLASDKDVEKVPELGVGRLARLWDGALFKYGASRAQCVIAQTQRQSERMAENFGRHATRIVRNFHPLPQEQVDRAAEFTVVWVANLKELKRPELFVKLAEDCQEEGGIAFRMIGRDPGTEWSSGVLAGAESLSNLTYCGELSQDAVNIEMAKAHLLVNTSEFEGFPNTFIQAWMRGVPTLSINVDPDGLLSNESLGVCSGSYEALKRSVLSYFSDEQRWLTTSDRVSTFAVEHFSLRNADRVIELIDEQLSL